MQPCADAMEEAGVAQMYLVRIMCADPVSGMAGDSYQNPSPTMRLGQNGRRGAC